MCTRCRVVYRTKRDGERGGRKRRRREGRKARGGEKEKERQGRRKREDGATTKIVWWRASRWSRTNPIDIPFFRECPLSPSTCLSPSLSLSRPLSISLSPDLSLALANFASPSRESPTTRPPDCPSALPFLSENDAQLGTAEGKREGRRGDADKSATR